MKEKRSGHIAKRLLFVSGVLMSTVLAYGAVDMFIKIGSIPGESLDSAHKGEIDVLAWSWGMSNSGTTHVGGGGGAGKANFQDLSFTKYIDKSSPILMLSCATGNHIADAKLVVRKAGGTSKEALEYIVIELKDLIVTSVSTGGSAGEDRLTENVSLNFSNVRVIYTPQNPDGSIGSPVEMTWDILTNTGG